MIRQYKHLIASLPKGSLICRRKEYYYLKYREGGKMHDEYIGRNPAVVSSVCEQLDQHRHYAKTKSYS